ncbi:SDR family NAD(P)-dependent oxidoreductase [Aquibaculum sediminis]|uniref:SDR family NAD(P)-dependent oxidoreductase n=1 Tax=Aquibaculum sediminis TaxID=3231907 RepID=UPI0034549054
MRRFENKTVLVFGAGSAGPGWGNGKAAAVTYARDGAFVAAVDRDLKAAEETVSIIAGEGGQARAFAADVTRSDDILAVVQALLQERGQIDVLHNNVGVTEMGGPEVASEESWQRVLDINATSVFLTCKHVLPGMRERRSGAVVNISSLAAIRWTGYPYLSYYAAKAAVNQMTVAMALEYAPHNVRVNAVMPGLINTPLIHQQIAGQYADAEAMVRERDALVPLGKMGTAWDVAEAAAFLASDQAKFITGVCLPVDGGSSAKVG